MKYNKIKRAIFVDRPNRFVAHVDIDGQIETVHVKNTGRCKELLLPGVIVILEESDNKERKTKYDLIAVYKAGLGLINMDSQAPNKVVYEWLKSERSIFEKLDYIRPEYTIGNSRIDFYCEKLNQKILIEVKGVTLEKYGIGYFPDAPTERGVKHLKELTALVQKGYECYVAFVIQMPGISEVRPNAEMHKEFADAFFEAQKAGVGILFLQCQIKEDELKIINPMS